MHDTVTPAKFIYKAYFNQIYWRITDELYQIQQQKVLHSHKNVPCDCCRYCKNLHYEHNNK